MILSFLIGIILRLINLMFSFFPALGNITQGFSTALLTLFNIAMPWNFIFPITDGLQLMVRAVQFEFAIILFEFGKWIVELIRGK